MVTLANGGAWLVNGAEIIADGPKAVSYTHLRAHETDSYLVCRLLLEKKKSCLYQHLECT